MPIKVDEKHYINATISFLFAVPCVPSDVNVTVDCSDNTASVSWGAAQGATSYSVVAKSHQGVNSSCESTTTSCTLTNLTCGVVYEVQVVSRDDVCSSLPSAPVEFHSGREKKYATVVTMFNLI